jgi:hypothetical protein
MYTSWCKWVSIFYVRFACVSFVRGELKAKVMKECMIMAKATSKDKNVQFNPLKTI